MWTDTNRALHARSGLALPTDLTDAEWARLEPLVPPPAATGRPRKWKMRKIIEAILYLLRGGLPWRMLPPCFPPASTVRRWFYLWRDSGLWLGINHTLLMLVREVPSPYKHGRPGGMARQRHRRAPVAFGQIRGGLPACLRRGKRGTGLDRPVSELLQREEAAFEPRRQDPGPSIF